MDDLSSQLRQGVARVFPAGYSKSLSMGVVDHCATEALMRDAADEIEHQRKLLDAARDTAVELAMGIRSAYQSELTRLRKIEAAARDVACVAANNPARRYKLNALRKALEAKQTDLHNSPQTCDD